MKILKLGIKNQSAIIKAAVKVLKKGGVIIYPTETAYGLGADFFNLKAIKKVYQIKGRQFNKPLPVIVSSKQMAKKIVKFDKASLELVKKYWPGPLTLILNFKVQTLKECKNLNYKTLGLRISSNKFATAIVKKFNQPITSTSANISGKFSCYSIEDVKKQFRNKKYQPDLVIDVGELPKQKPSTIVQVVDGKVKVLREGCIKIRSTKS